MDTLYADIIFAIACSIRDSVFKSCTGTHSVNIFTYRPTPVSVSDLLI